MKPILTEKVIREFERSAMSKTGGILSTLGGGKALAAITTATSAFTLANRPKLLTDKRYKI